MTVVHPCRVVDRARLSFYHLLWLTALTVLQPGFHLPLELLLVDRADALFNEIALGGKFPRHNLFGTAGHMGKILFNMQQGRALRGRRG